MPGIFPFKGRRGGDEFARVDNASASERENEIEFVFPYCVHGFQARFVFGICFDSGEFNDFPFAERRNGLVVRAVFLDASSAVNEQYTRIFRD